MQWWNDFLDWLNSNAGGRVVSTIIIPFIAIVVAGIVAALIGRASARKVIELSEREVRASAVTALISAARKAAVWNSLPAPEQQHIDHLISDSEIRLRLLPVAGTTLAADWAAHEIAGMKRNAVSFSFQAEQSLLVFRDRLIAWQARPSRAKKLFKNDLDSWAYDSSVSEQELVHQQQAWAAQQVTATGPIKTIPAPTLSRPPAAPILHPAASEETAVSAPPAPAPVVDADPIVAPVAPPSSPLAAPLASPVASSPAVAAPKLGPSGGAEAATATVDPLPTPWAGFRPVASSRVEPEASPAPGTPKEFPTALIEPKDDAPRDVSSASIFSKPELESASASASTEVEAPAAEGQPGEPDRESSNEQHTESSGEQRYGDEQHADSYHSDSNGGQNDHQEHHDEQRENQDEQEAWRG
jgi:hypothetical protein